MAATITLEGQRVQSVVLRVRGKKFTVVSMHDGGYNSFFDDHDFAPGAKRREGRLSDVLFGRGLSEDIQGKLRAIFVLRSSNIEREVREWFPRCTFKFE